MNKPSTYAFLPTDKESSIWITSLNGKVHLGKSEVSTHSCVSQHLYILSSDDIKNKDYVECLGKIYNVSVAEKECLYFNNVSTKAYRKDCRKIIATTNTELHWKDKIFAEILIPMICKSDIEYIIFLHNEKDKEIVIDFEKEGLNTLKREGYWSYLFVNSDYPSKPYPPSFERELHCIIMGMIKQSSADKKFTLQDIKNIIEIFQQGWTNKLNPDLDKVIESLMKVQTKSNIIMVEYEDVHDTDERYITSFHKFNKELYDKDCRNAKLVIENGCITIVK